MPGRFGWSRNGCVYWSEQMREGGETGGGRTAQREDVAGAGAVFGHLEALKVGNILGTWGGEGLFLWGGGCKHMCKHENGLSFNAGAAFRHLEALQRCKHGCKHRAEIPVLWGRSKAFAPSKPPFPHHGRGTKCLRICLHLGLGIVRFFAVLSGWRGGGRKCEKINAGLTKTSVEGVWKIGSGNWI